MMAWFSGCLARPVAAENGILRWDEIRRKSGRSARTVRPPAPISIENTRNMAGGTVYPLEAIHEICDGAHELGLKVHMDGARVFNAAAASDVPVREIVANADTVMFCLSKALGAPVVDAGRTEGDASRRAASIASGWAAVCGRPACWPRPAWSRWKRRRRSWPKIIATRSFLAEGLAADPRHSDRPEERADRTS